MLYRILISVGIVAAFASPAWAHWDGVTSKMETPQPPDPQGWDVNATFPKVLADDFKCSQTGYIKDIHWWGSWEYDQEAPLAGFWLSIHSDIPATPTDHSRPGDLLWLAFVPITAIHYDIWGLGPQGWYDPNTGVARRPDHETIWEYNLTDIPDALAFYQEKGTIYWLDISAVLASGVPDTYKWGWKTSYVHWNDDAVWNDWATGPSIPPAYLYPWRELRDPFPPYESLDLAFVITPEPASMMLLALGGLAMLRRRPRH